MKYKCLVVLLMVATASIVQSCSSSSDKPVSAIHASTAAHEQVAEKIQKIVTDTKRADKSISIAEQMFKESEDFLELVNESREKSIELSENYDTNRETLESHYKVFLQQRKLHSEKYITLSFQLRHTVTKDEWLKINDVLTNEMQKISAVSAEKG